MCLKILIFPQKIRSGFAFYIEKMIYQQIFMLKKLIFIKKFDIHNFKNTVIDASGRSRQASPKGA